MIRGGKLKEIFNKIIKVVGWIALFAALSSFGFASESPSIAIPLYAVFFIIVFGLVYLFVKKNQKRHEMDVNVKTTMHKVLGICLLLISLMAPTLIFRSANFPLFSYIIITVIVAILIVLSILAITMGIIQYDSSYNALGTAYYSAILVSIFAWWGISLYTNKES
jgi:cytochrome bd-type quinol oxidase subunit 2